MSASVTIRTNVSPDVTFDPTAKQTGQAGANLLGFVRPSVDFDVPVIGKLHYAPYGEPTGAGLSVLAAVAGLALYGLWRILTD